MQTQKKPEPSRLRPEKEKTVKKTLDAKLETIRACGYTPADFIIADAKDADMAMGVAAPGSDPARPGRFKTKPEYLAAMREMTASGLVDIMLMSVSSAEVLGAEGIFTDSPVTPAVRANDATDIWFARGNRYVASPSRPFSSANLQTIPETADLGLYSVTFSNDLEADYETLSAYADFRADAAHFGVRHFLEVFNPHPSLDVGLTPIELPGFINDCILRTLAGVASAEQPLFLKIAYNGPAAMEELASYDPSRLVVGILGGSKGTTRDAFELVSQAEKHGARVALFGRKINLAEHPTALVALMRRVVEGDVKPAEAVRAYHDALAKQGLASHLPLEKDLEITESVLR